jgi:hypothetical protein
MSATTVMATTAGSGIVAPLVLFIFEVVHDLLLWFISTVGHRYIENSSEDRDVKFARRAV